MKNSIGLPASGLFTSRVLARAVAACFESPVLRGAALASALALGAMTSAQAATITVTNTNSTGPGSLAAALHATQRDNGRGDKIIFDSSVSGEIDLGAARNNVFYGAIEIVGPGVDRLTIKGGKINSWWYYDDSYGYGHLKVSGLTFEGARIGGAFLEVNDCELKGGDAFGHELSIQDSLAQDAEISGVYELSVARATIKRSKTLVYDGNITLIDSLVTGSPEDGLLVRDSWDDHEYDAERITIRNSVIEGSAGAGIRFDNDQVEALIENSVIRNNVEDGLRTDMSGVFDITARNSEVSGNGGAGMLLRAGASSKDRYTSINRSKFNVDNITFADNALGGMAIEVGDHGHLTASKITRSTIAGNRAERGGGISIRKAPDTTDVGPAWKLAVDSTIIGKNTASVSGPDLFTDVPGVSFVANYSLIQNPAGTPIATTVPGSNITGQDPKLMRLANLGGATSVRALGAGSPALNKGNPSLASSPATDQRGAGFPRVAGGRIDIGAFEQQAVDVAPVVLRSLPDVTGNGTPELAALLQSIPTGATTVRVRDALTGAAHWQVTLPGAGEAIDLETLGDVNGNGKRDIAVLRTAPASVAIRDGLTGAAVKTIALTSGFFPKALATLADVNGNGKPEVAVLGTKAGKSVVELRDSQSGALIKAITFNSPGTPRDVVALRQQAGNASSAALIGVLMDVRDPTKSDALEIRNALTGALVTRGDVGAGAESMEAAVLPDSNGNSANEFAVLKSSGEVRVFDLPGFEPMTTMQFLDGDIPLHLTTVPDTNGSGVTELAVLSRHQADGALKAEVRDAATGAIVSTMNYSSQYRADELVSVPDINNNGVVELSHVGPNSSGVVRATQRDVATGVLSSRVNMAP